MQDSRPYHEQHRSLIPPNKQHQHIQDYHYRQHSDSFVNDLSRPLDRILGCNVDTYIDEHKEQYERALARWKNCTMEEWTAGADGNSLVTLVLLA